MKQKSLLACMLLLITSCSLKTYYQVVEVKSTNVQKESNNYVYNDGVCKITYNFWSEGGNAGFSIDNLSDDVIYLDLTNSFFIVNGSAYDYYKARNFGFGKTKGKSLSKSLSESIGKSVSKSVGKSSGLSESATAYGTLIGGFYSGYPGSITKQESSENWSQISSQVSSQFSFQVSSTIFEAVSSNIAYAEKPIIAIPPHATKTISEYKIIGDVIQDCSVNLMVEKNKPEGMTFTESETPLSFRNYISYRKGERGEIKAVTNDFYVGGFTNYLSTDIIKEEKVGCKNTIELDRFEKYGSDRFYVEYYNNHSNHYSADAKGNATTKVKKKVSSTGSSYYSVRKE